MSLRSHQDLEVWQMAMELAKVVYRQTAQFPKEELYGLTAQLRRSAVSAPSNIAEGAARNARRDFERFLYIAMSSLAELETQWILAKELAFVPDGEDDILPLVRYIRIMLLGLIRKIKKLRKLPDRALSRHSITPSLLSLRHSVTSSPHYSVTLSITHRPTTNTSM